ncbi:MAG: outer membrane protein transport protein [Xanthomonadaceae bacterium]|jgi:long-chain fatty acid transport protein|nr:outer membrane protein transport protein [Xanthomonadaceae bacterium]
MQFIQSITRISVLAAGIAGALACGQAHAAAFQLKENSAKGQGRAFAGSISAPDDASVVGTNPAAMRLLDGRQFQFDVSTIRFSAKYSGEAHDALGRPLTGGNGGDAGMIAPLPSVYAHLPVGDKLHFGASLMVPFGFETDYSRNWVGRYNGLRTKLQAVDLGVSMSYDVNPYVSFGVSVFAERLNVQLTNAVDFGGILAGSGVPGYLPASADGMSSLKGDNTQVGFTVGGLFSITDDTHIGINYRSQMVHKVTGGTVDFYVPGDAAAIFGATRPGWFTDTKGRATITLPELATISLTHRINDQWSIMADVSRTAWSKFDSVRVHMNSGQPDNMLNFGYRDTTFASIGADYRLNDQLTLRGGLAYDQTPTTNEHRDVRVPDASRKWVSLGLSWAPGEHAEYNIGYTHLFASDPRIVDLTSTTGTVLDGHYKVSSDILAASINYKF